MSQEKPHPQKSKSKRPRKNRKDLKSSCDCRWSRWLDNADYRPELDDNRYTNLPRKYKLLVNHWQPLNAKNFQNYKQQQSLTGKINSLTGNFLGKVGIYSLGPDNDSTVVVV